MNEVAAVLRMFPNRSRFYLQVTEKLHKFSMQFYMF